MKRKVTTYVISVIGVVVLLAAIVGLNLAIQNGQNSDSAGLSGQTRLNVAIVNEDQAVNMDGKNYQLGSDYIKTIERDNSQNWSVVSPGTATSGLKNGSYQLVITIPTDFSSKLLEINDENASPATVQYKVNAKGNQKIELAAEKVGKDIVAGLNGKLVDMYMASVLSNLYTAQQNVKALTGQEQANISAYKTNLLDSASQFKTDFPSLTSSANSNMASNQSLMDSLDSLSNQVDSLTSSQAKFGDSLSSLVEQRSQDKISYGEFTQSLLSMNQSLLSGDLATMTQSLENSQKDLSGLLGQTISSTDTTKSQLDALNQTIQDLEDTISQQKTIIENENAQIDSFASNVLKNSNISTIQNKTVGELLTSNNAIKSYLSDLQSSISQTNQQLVNQLPTIDASGLAQLEGNMTLLDSQAADKVKSFNTALAQPYQSAYHASSLGTELADLKAKLEAASQASASASAAANTTAKVSVRSTSSDLTITSWSVNGETHNGSDEATVTLKANNQFTFHYQYANGSSGTSTNSNGDITVAINGVTATSTATSETDYRNAAVAYAKKVQEIADAYHNANQVLSQNSQEKMTNLLNQPVKSLLSDLLRNTIQSELEDSKEKAQASVETLEKQLATLQSQKDDLADQLNKIQSENETLASSIGNQLSALKDLQDQANDLTKEEGTVTSAQDDADSKLSSLASDLSSLVSSTSELKTSSSSNLSQADSVHNSLSAFQSDVTQAQTNGNKLSNDSQTLMTAFDKELKDSGDFSKAFSSVFSNAYPNGVANNQLIGFLSRPVNESASAIKSNEQVYHPFTWILLLEVVSLFAAYLFATYNLTKKLKDKFNLNRLMSTDIVNVAILFALGLVIGLVIGALSASKLAISQEYLPSWILTVTLASLLLIQGQYLLLKNIKAIGMGLSLYMIISYVYLSNATGVAVGLKGFPLLLKKANLLGLLENTLTGYFNNQTTSIWLILPALAVIIVLMVVNTLVTLHLSERFRQHEVEK